MNYFATDLTTSPISEWTDKPRPLTHDEKKAAEAAFRGDAFNPAWSLRARKVYDELSKTIFRLGCCRFS